MKKTVFFLIANILLFALTGNQQLVAQNAATPKNSAEIFAQLKSIGVLGSVLYIAAHPDDENNSFLPYLVKERNLRTGYLSLTRGDGGQNLIGKEQGVELGMIRTQELIAARKQDGAEQYFSTAYEFGFSKSAEEALKIWDHQKVLSDVVWVIRKFQPDIIITRFPGDARAGHGHHAASSIISNEAFTAAADPKQFPEQLQKGVTVWKAKRILWNTFNFGSVNTTNNNQLKIEVGGYNPILGKSYGEVGAEARTMHKSQGEGRPRRRGPSYEFFENTGGEAASTDLMDGINTQWDRLNNNTIQNQINEIVQQYQFAVPEKSVAALVKLYQSINTLPNSVWKEYKLAQVQNCIQDCAGILIEATTQQQQVIPGQPLALQYLLNQRSSVKTNLTKITFPLSDSASQQNTTNQQVLNYNQNIQLDYKFTVPTSTVISQPYWLVEPKTEGMFVVNDYALIGKAENDPSFSVTTTLRIEGQAFDFKVPVYYKYTDPTKGDQYQPIAVVPAQEVKYDKEVYLTAPGKAATVSYQIINHTNDPVGKITAQTASLESTFKVLPSPAGAVYRKTIQYDHIPSINYFPTATTKVVAVAVKTKGNAIGYIEGAGDKIPEALTALGFQVVTLKAEDLTSSHLESLKKLDAIVVGIRAYNMFDYLTNQNEVLNAYIEQGGNLIVQYLKSNQVGINKIKVGPYPFSVNASKRVTQEEVPVDFILPNHAVLNTPNKITAPDFENWVQERSTYQAENMDAHFEMPLSMHDANEPASIGSLLIAPYGKGNMVYLSLTLFRQLPAGNPGAYKLMANLIALPKH